MGGVVLKSYVRVGPFLQEIEREKKKTGGGGKKRGYDGQDIQKKKERMTGVNKDKEKGEKGEKK